MCKSSYDLFGKKVEVKTHPDNVNPRISVNLAKLSSAERGYVIEVAREIAASIVWQGRKMTLHIVLGRRASSKAARDRLVDNFMHELDTKSKQRKNAKTATRTTRAKNVGTAPQARAPRRDQQVIPISA